MDELQERHFNLQKDIYFSHRATKGDWGILYWSEWISNSFWNYLSCNPHITEEDWAVGMEKILSSFKSIHRTPALYCLKGSAADKLCRQNGMEGILFRKAFSDAWMTSELADFQEESSMELTSLTQGKDGPRAGEALLRIYREGPLLEALPGEYGEAAARALTLENKRVSHFLNNRKRGEATAFCTVICEDLVAGLYNFGVESNHRKNGTGTEFLKSVLSHLKKESITSVFLQTEAGSPTEAWYGDRGFSTQRIFNCYTVEERNR